MSYKSITSKRGVLLETHNLSELRNLAIITCINANLDRF